MGADELCAQLFAQVVDVNFHGVAGDFLIPAVEFFFDLLARQHFIAVIQKQLKQLEFFAGQLDVLPLITRLVRARVQAQAGVFQRWAGRRGG